MTTRPAGDLQFRLSPAGLGFSVDVRLRRYGERWVAQAEAAGRPGVGLATTPREALVAALCPLGTRASRVLLADPALMAVSTSVMEASR